MKISKTGILIIFGISLLSAWTQKHLTFFGESENWSIHYEVENSNDYRGTIGNIRNIGNAPIPEGLEYSISNSEGSASLEENGVFTMPRSRNGCVGCTSSSENSEIEAIIKWDNNSELIPLIARVLINHNYAAPT
ncbi:MULTISPECIES: hypothetical protein [unclassified Sporosarcina]|uniref:hypothetical protein n=1 Tax=unclassified Sporosarcina TaxID=2647733 RepID=UPI001A92CDEC|nr:MULTISPECIES: hypothetical protein [unclassified Sporosarcina]MBO0588385.1 hypothetical protein [Sporosarcina sp. E16_8]MBO0603649.1 hypothetical protein [Sporosarcina sp. E16_3]